MFILLITRKRV